MKTILNRYIAKEMLPTFLTGLFLAVFTVVVTRLLSITELIINRGVGIGSVIGIIGYLLPDVVGFALPATALIAVVMAFLRLSADSEFVALKASGVSLYQMLPPVVLFSVFNMLAGAWILAQASPWGQNSFRNLVFDIAKSQADLAIKERVFTEPFKGVTFYVQSYDSREKVMKDVFVNDRREKNLISTVVASEAKLFKHPDKRTLTIRFINGTVFVTDKDLSSSRTIRFASYDLTVGIGELLRAASSREKSPKELTIGELKGHLDKIEANSIRHNELMIELMEKATLPVAIFLMGMIGVPLGVYIRGRGKYSGVGVSLMVFLAYYVCLMGSRNIGESGYLPPLVVVLIPVTFLAVFGLYAYLRIGAEKALIPDRVTNIWKRFTGRISNQG
ncbi:MAG: LPS export ABC transporter permease LptF [Deltaproteobacteria bacterium CG23_combo_of_CG06-09_8_20_14_all_51_20]|nr:LPS export ABC transporter permease LptF [bacterium]OIP41359.1 MAG: LPS export ABC transporter permease LptF [Desulfobacteraceae bacterium CG2_30_51_40]PIP46596.1 MAG: LPS export ABC transporter permease LptF [Deltaproteobacteria bacterium CG23_combo_of_CG06-09_8_20_14_all_51_20]PIV98804.1 MAG: LPS export ABC transporter permease LptF [Deltaproteobacteria bacterium CG17_big_fil_post_rev_8_21_14_2_50_51_6]PIY22022.1 MAG: LPS export ABC transporter permease LptF [Deltaproteobacteria bacterium 